MNVEKTFVFNQSALICVYLRLSMFCPFSAAGLSSG